MMPSYSQRGVPMRKLVLTSIALLALNAGGSALAADMPVKARPLPPPPPVYNWTGCYVGVGVGYGMFNQDREVVSTSGGILAPSFAGVIDSFAFVNNVPAGTVLGKKETFGGRGWLGTAQLGCDVQFAGPFGGNWLIGAFVDGDWSNIRGDHSLFGLLSGEQKLRSSWAVGGRIGWLVTPNLLTYFSAGYTQAKFDAVDYVGGPSLLSIPVLPAVFSLQVFPLGGGLSGVQLGSQRYNGFFVGGGTEYAIGWWPGLFWKTEYRFADYRSQTTPIICISCPIVVNGGPAISERIHPYVQTVRTELVWRFNWGKAPVVARY
jgi:outer membrane immunogenic protein